jgi:MFS family permease
LLLVRQLNSSIKLTTVLLSLNVPPEKMATYSGLAESLVSLGDLVYLPLVSITSTKNQGKANFQHIKLIQWFPHRYLIITSLLLSGAVASLMGLSTHIWQILALRALTALFSFGGFLASIALGEVVQKEEGGGGQAFSLFASATFLGAMLGSLIGGYMAEPVGRVPILGRMEVFRDRHYVAPGLTMGALTVLCAVAIWFLVPEVRSSPPAD